MRMKRPARLGYPLTSSAALPADPREAQRERAAKRRHATERAQERVAPGPGGTTAHGRDGGEAPGQSKHRCGYRSAIQFVAIENHLAFRSPRAGAENVNEAISQIERVLDTGVHPLTARGTVHVRGVAREKDATLAEVLGQAVMDTESPAPDDVADTARR